ncbi:class I SAM-dependent methyltransferase [Methylosinus trichosporium]|uniref:Class I SAM-dependent methyltransferase n=2 Tax=Methylosinus TaxID=425 RepID=A0A2D2D5V9_METT3|nr:MULTISPECIES: class I SAM-dependent methyltransferase [Methylosinus]ATQ70344.1 class I SAM-dependent methyltransferase [Methylosinus trichosporium OB3b]OBS51391.1 methyltransferase [Methylosinus sp. 3S-1]
MNEDPRAHLPFSNPAFVSDYASETLRKVPGLADLHRMAMLLLSERAPEAAKILVVGAGGGAELKALAEAQSAWTFIGVDPSAEMLELARRTIEPFGDRAELLQGYIDSVPSGPFDGATCLLTLHFLAKSERLWTLKEIHRRLRAGGFLVVAHHSSADDGNAERWLARSVAFADRSGVDPAKAAASAASMAARLPVVPAAEDEALLREAGFVDLALFYAGFSFRGWVASASGAASEITKAPQ